MEFPKKRDPFFSMTKFTTFESCGYKYAFQYRKRIPQPANKYLIAGIAVHEALEWALKEFNDGVKHTTKEIMLKALQHASPRLPELIVESHKQDIVDIISKSLLQYDAYKLFKPDMIPESTLRLEYNDIPLVMKADIIYQPEGSKNLLIGDYKTSSAFHKKDVIFQASLYHHSVKQLMPKSNPTFAAIMLKLNKIYTVDPWPEDKFWGYVTRLTEEIRKEDWKPNTKSCFAFNSPCPFSKRCPYFRS